MQIVHRKGSPVEYVLGAWAVTRVRRPANAKSEALIVPAAAIAAVSHPRAISCTPRESRYDARSPSFPAFNPLSLKRTGVSASTH